jgi:hypothetical protein
MKGRREVAWLGKNNVKISNQWTYSQSDIRTSCSLINESWEATWLGRNKVKISNPWIYSQSVNEGRGEFNARHEDNKFQEKFPNKLPQYTKRRYPKFQKKKFPNEFPQYKDTMDWFPVSNPFESPMGPMTDKSYELRELSAGPAPPGANDE